MCHQPGNLRQGQNDDEEVEFEEMQLEWSPSYI